MLVRIGHWNQASWLEKLKCAMRSFKISGGKLTLSLHLSESILKVFVNKSVRFHRCLAFSRYLPAQLSNVESTESGLWRSGAGSTQPCEEQHSALWWRSCSRHSPRTGTSPGTPAQHVRSMLWWRWLCGGGGRAQTLKTAQHSSGQSRVHSLHHDDDVVDLDGLKGAVITRKAKPLITSPFSHI